MISGVPLFRGRDNNDQLNQILRILGTPDEATLRRIATESVRTFPSPPPLLPTDSYVPCSPRSSSDPSHE
jgi:negative regulator of PHO system